jgi:hypothetical protein
MEDVGKKMLVCFMAIWYILRPIDNFYAHLVHFVVIRSIFSHFGTLNQETSGNPDTFTQIKFESKTKTALFSLKSRLKLRCQPLGTRLRFSQSFG